MSDHYDDDKGTYIKTKCHSYEFSWNSGQNISTITHSSNCLAEIPINDGYEVFGVLRRRIKPQMDPKIYFRNCSYMNQKDIPEDYQFPRFDFGTAIVTDDEYSLDEE